MATFEAATLSGLRKKLDGIVYEADFRDVEPWVMDQLRDLRSMVIGIAQPVGDGPIDSDARPSGWRTEAPDWWPGRA